MKDSSIIADTNLTAATVMLLAAEKTVDKIPPQRTTTHVTQTTRYDK